MRLGFIGAFISVAVIMVALGGIAWSFYSAPSSYAMESEGLHRVIDLERQSMSNNFYNRSSD
ncbi:MAG: hypothetical protein O2909_01675 [Chloroflexi bacterium]|nr:hypothetical protein [Chloroflexota bacterium]MDA1218139.1 hypothetical protein [Chloroflexota bacterium]PKB57416.1 MAG: hypothetical protein BZY73_03330 [SAR202 cluster bacterium Casp-Chloro-G3]